MIALVTDRSQSDVARIKSLFAKGWENLTNAERAEYIGSPAPLASVDGYMLASLDNFIIYAPTGIQRGTYNATDLNRVNEAFVYLRDKMNGTYGFNLSLIIKTDWTRQDLGQLGAQTLMEQYRQNVVKIRGAITQITSTPAVPASMRFFTYQEANAIERILQDVEYLLSVMDTTFVSCGDAICGGEYI